MHSRIRNNCSNLNSDLCNNHLRDDPYCQCSETVEDAEHYLLQCPLYDAYRVTLFQSLRQFQPLRTCILLQGIHQQEDELNSTIFRAVQTYIKSTKRFEY